MRSVSRQALLLILLLLLAGCGQKGDLYLPDDDTVEESRAQVKRAPVLPA